MHICPDEINLLLSVFSPCIDWLKMLYLLYIGR